MQLALVDVDEDGAVVVRGVLAELGRSAGNLKWKIASSVEFEDKVTP